ncbi:hypothetical protein ABBQ38_004096 [Trebouxia sp. C0009 RCD-2024]
MTNPVILAKVNRGSLNISQRLNKILHAVTMASVSCALLSATAVSQRSPCFTSRSPAQAVPVVRLASFRQAIGTNSLRTLQSQRPARITRSGPAVQASAVEVFQLADEGSLIAGTAAVLFACTLVGLAIGFVLLRVEALVEEGKI